MVYIGSLSGLIALFYPQEPIAKVDQLGEQLDIVRFYYHHWMVMTVPMLMALLTPKFFKTVPVGEFAG